MAFSYLSPMGSTEALSAETAITETICNMSSQAGLASIANTNRIDRPVLVSSTECGRGICGLRCDESPRRLSGCCAKRAASLMGFYESH